MKHPARSELRLRRPIGFTLIELLVAVAILALVAVLAWRGLDEIVRSKVALEGSLEDERALAQLFDQIAFDARAAVPERVLGRPALALGTSSVSIVREVDVDGAAPRWQVIVYRLDSGWVVRATSVLLRDRGTVATAIAQTAVAPGLPIVPNAAAMHLSLFRAGSGWSDALGGASSISPVIVATPAVPPTAVTTASVANVLAPAPESILALRAELSVTRDGLPYRRIMLVGR